MAKWKPASNTVTARSRKAFKRGVMIAHGRKREERDAALASRNAYREAIGLPPITIAK